MIDESAPADAQFAPIQESGCGFFYYFLLLAEPMEREQARLPTTRSCKNDDWIDGRSSLLSRPSLYCRAFCGNVRLVRSRTDTCYSGANFLGGTDLPAALLAAIIVSALLNLFVGSASAKWALIAPVMVPMLMLLGISPEMATEPIG